MIKIRKFFSKKMFFVLIIFIIILYFIIQICHANINSVDTEIAVNGKMLRQIEVEEAYAVRDEVQVDNSSSPITGFLSYFIENGERVESGGTIAAFYTNSANIVNKKIIKSIDDEVKKLKRINSNSRVLSVSPDMIDKQVCQEMKIFLTDLNEQNYSKAAEQQNDISYLLNERQIVVGQVSNFNERISELEGKKKNIPFDLYENGKILSPSAGYFVKNLKNNEINIDYKSVLLTTPKILKEKIEKQSKSNNSSIGKIVTNQKWYVVCNVLNKNICDFNLYDDVKIQFSLAFSGNLSMKVVAINQEKNSEESTLILECDNVTPDLMSVNCFKNLKIITEGFEGIKINKKAFREIVDDENKMIQGVYVLKGNQIVFKKIKALYSDDNYIICSDEKVEGSETVSLYDKVVIKGKNLYDGKLIY